MRMVLLYLISHSLLRNNWIVSASGAHTIIKVWDLNGELKRVLTGHFFCIKSICVIDNHLYSGSTGLILIWNNLESNVMLFSIVFIAVAS